LSSIVVIEFELTVNFFILSSFSRFQIFIEVV